MCPNNRLSHLQRGFYLLVCLATTLILCNQAIVRAADCNTQSFQNPRDFSVGDVWVHAVGVEDFNKDQKPDLAVVVAHSNTVAVLWGDGMGNFPTSTQLAVGTLTLAEVTGDFNGDTNPDVAAISFQEGLVYVYLGDGVGGFQGPLISDAGSSPRSVTSADFNGDGKADLGVVSERGLYVSVLSGSGTGTFALMIRFPVTAGPYGIASSDLDRDGAVDIVTSNNGSGEMAVFYNLGGSFTPGPHINVGSGEPSWPTIADFNGDGNPDIAATNNNRQYGAYISEVSVLLGIGNRQFSKVTSSLGRSSNNLLKVVDINGDHKLDIVSESGMYDTGYLDIRLGNGDGRFSQPLSFFSRPNPIDVGVGDFNGDGRPDLITGNYFDASISVFINDGVGDQIPPILFVQDLRVGASGVSGTAVSFPAVFYDVSEATLSCSIPSGSTFPIGVTFVTCVATDACGNSSGASFYVTVVDEPPVLSLPPYISTNATSSSGAVVTYFASADDSVSGQLTPQCNPASGSNFPISTTEVNCSVTDDAGNTATGSFNVYVLTADQIFTPPDGYYVTVQPASGPTITFSYVDGGGVTTVTPIDAASIGTTPAGFALSNGIAYQISTTATFYDYIQLDFAVPGPISETDFNNLSILHNNNGTLEDVTGGRSYDAQSQSGTITAYTDSFSPFYLAKRVTTRVATLFDETKAFKSGSTVPVKLQVLNESDANISASTLQLRARNLVRLGTNTTAAVIDAGNSNPDLNFRYDAGFRGYIFNLKTTDLAPGAYALSFYVGSDRSFFYTVKFEVK